MKCPYCTNGIVLEVYHTEPTSLMRKSMSTFRLQTGYCPLCEGYIVTYETGVGTKSKEGYMNFESHSLEIVYPKFITRAIENEVPEPYKKDFSEACAVVSISPKASAALSRRILQSVLHNEYKIVHPNLAQEIDAFIKLPNVPSYLTEAVDAVRHYGNFAAHPLADTTTGEVVDVEPGEAEWLLEVIESLFDYVFVQPKRLAEKKDKLNAKLSAAGKPLMKEKK